MMPFTAMASEPDWRSELMLDQVNSIVSVLPQTGAGQINSDEPEGTGFAVLDGHFVVTADHVLGGANRILLRSNVGEVFEAEIVVRDRDTDLALLRSDNPLKPLKMPEGVIAGEDVCAVGNAFGLGLSLSCGIVSATQRRGIGFNRIEDFVQTDAAINPGMSGAPLFKAPGVLTGIVTAIFTKRSDGNLGVNFASSAALLSAFLDDARDGKIERQRPGLALRPVPNAGETGRSGTRVMKVATASAEARAGVAEGDIVVKAGDLAVRHPADYLAAVALNAPGEPLKLEIFRGEHLVRVTIDFDQDPEGVTSMPGAQN